MVPRLILVLALALLAAAESSAQVKVDDDGPVRKVAVTTSGKVSFDGRPVTLDQLRQKLVELKRRNGTVWYYREAPQAEEPPKEAMEVIKMMVDNRLPISMFTKPDYSERLMVPGTGGRP